MINRTLGRIAFLITIIIFSVILFLSVKNKEYAFWISYIFSLIAITGVYISGGIVSVNKKSKTAVSLIYLSVSVLYLAAQLMLMFILLVSEADIATCLWTELGLFGIAAVLFIVSIMAKRGITKAERNTSDNVTEIRMLYSDIDIIRKKAVLLNVTVRENVIKKLDNIYENIRFSDPMINENIKSIDDDLKKLIAKISEEIEKMISTKSKDTSEFDILISKIDILCTDRKNRIKLLKNA